MLLTSVVLLKIYALSLVYFLFFILGWLLSALESECVSVSE